MPDTETAPAQQQQTNTQVQDVNLEQAPQDIAQQSEAGLDMFLDMNVNIMVTVGHTQMSFKKLLQLGPGSVIKLDKPIEAPADIYIKGSKFATGEIVVVDEKFGIRIKNIINNTTQPNQ